MLTIKTDDTDLGQICDSGQCFRMRRLDESMDRAAISDRDILSAHGAKGAVYEIIAADRRILAMQTDNGIALDCDDMEYESFWREYLDMDTDYAAIRASVDAEDKYLADAVRTGRGLRILKQELWEMIVTFLISQQNNIPRIHKCIDNICVKYGEYKPCGDYYSFPAADRLSALGEDELMPCNLGYRSKYVVRAARSVIDGSLDLDAIRRMDYTEARHTLLGVYGIGEKVADCICLFGLHHLRAFPVDTHIRQVIDREYGGDFDYDRYREYLGVIQQYMFYNEIA